MLRHLDLFSGIGGFALGLARAGGYETVGFVELDPQAQAVLRDHWPEVPIHDDIRSFRGGEFGAVDIVTGGFPCQPWSVAGRRGGADDGRDLWPEMRRVVAACRPRWVVAENVPGLVQPELGLARVLADLGALGYQTVTVCIPAAGVGAPHRRDRVWIVAHAAGERRQGRHPPGQRERPGAGGLLSAGPGELCAVADAECRAAERHRHEMAAAPGGVPGAARQQRIRPDLGHDGTDCGAVADRVGAGLEGRAGRTVERERPAAERDREGDAWADAVWLGCADGAARRVEPGIRLLAHGVPGRVAALRLLGNAVVPQVVERLGRAIRAADAGSAADDEAVAWACCMSSA